jgi:hypothetical protein
VDDPERRVEPHGQERDPRLAGEDSVQVVEDGVGRVDRQPWPAAERGAPLPEGCPVVGEQGS